MHVELGSAYIPQYRLMPQRCEAPSISYSTVFAVFRAQTHAAQLILQPAGLGTVVLHSCYHCCGYVAGPGQGARTAFEDSHQLMLALKQHWPDTAAVAEQFEARPPACLRTHT
jgi:hypothetical protein